MKKLISLFCLFLGSCASVPSAPQVSYIEVKVPVAVPCKVPMPDKPTFLLQEAKEEESFGIKLKKGLSEIETRKAYELELEAAIKACQ